MKNTAQKTDGQYNIFIANDVFPEAEQLFASGPSSLNAIKDDCIVVLDTNVLLIPFTTGQESLEQIEKTLSYLASASRLMIPGQVAREFVKNRATKLSELFQQLNRKMSSVPQLQRGRYPLLNSLDSYQRAVALEEEIDAKIREYRKTLQDVRDHVQNWIWNDPVSTMYNNIFKSQVILDLSINREEITKLLDNQNLHKIPPGYKDSEKDDKGVGDLLIWTAILEVGRSRKQNLLFVTGDDKADWWYRSDKSPLYPRYELVDEYRRISEGKFFHIIHFSTLLDLYGASEQVVEEIRQKEAITQTSIAVTGPEVLIAKYKMEMERRLRSLAELYGIGQSRVSGSHLMAFLRKQGVLSPDSFRDFDKVWRVCNYTVHGEAVLPEDIELVKENAPIFISQLGDLMAQFSNQDDEEPATSPQ